MLRHLAGATIQIANLIDYNCHPQAGGNYLFFYFNLSIQEINDKQINSSLKYFISWYFNQQ